MLAFFTIMYVAHRNHVSTFNSQTEPKYIDYFGPKSHHIIDKVVPWSTKSYLVVQRRTLECKIVPCSTKSYLVVQSRTL